MKTKITYAIITVTFIISAFFIGRIATVKTENPDILNMNAVTDFETTETGLLLYTSNGDGYYWEK